MNTYVYVCKCLCIHIYICIDMYIYIYISTFMYIYNINYTHDNCLKMQVTVICSCYSATQCETGSVLFSVCVQGRPNRAFRDPLRSGRGVHTRRCPLGIDCLINAVDYRYITHKLKLLELQTNLAILGAPPVENLSSKI